MEETVCLMLLLDFLVSFNELDYAYALGSKEVL